MSFTAFKKLHNIPFNLLRRMPPYQVLKDKNGRQANNPHKFAYAVTWLHKDHKSPSTYQYNLTDHTHLQSWLT